MIIMTKRPAGMLIMDTIITSVAWLAFVYQFTQGVVFLVAEHPGVPLSTAFGISLNPTSSTLIACVVICSMNALIVFAWGNIRSTSHGKAYGHHNAQQLSADVLADHFNLSPQQLGEVWDSRVTVVYHSATGGITHLETDDLQLQSNTTLLASPIARVA